MSKHKPSAPLSQTDGDALAVYLANKALGYSFKPVEAATALWQAAALMALAHLPKETLLEVLDSVHAITRAEIAEAIGVGVTRQ